jgi:predicted nucleotidyltransferase
MMKEGRFRAFRNLPVGWVLQIIHSTDRTERYFRIFFELMIFAMLFSTLAKTNVLASHHLAFLLSFVVVHTLSWLFVGNFWVYMLDSFKWVKNPGIKKTVDFMLFCRKAFTLFDCCEAVLVYGSMSRSMFHNRSDLDLRVIRRVDSPLGYIAIVIGFLVRFYSFFLIQPVDLQVVDSLQFLRKQMRDDELPIVIHIRKGFQLDVNKISIQSLTEDPTLVLKPVE